MYATNSNIVYTDHLAINQNCPCAHENLQRQMWLGCAADQPMANCTHTASISSCRKITHRNGAISQDRLGKNVKIPKHCHHPFSPALLAWPPISHIWLNLFITRVRKIFIFGCFCSTICEVSSYVPSREEVSFCHSELHIGGNPSRERFAFAISFDPRAICCGRRCATRSVVFFWRGGGVEVTVRQLAWVYFVERHSVKVKFRRTLDWACTVRGDRRQVSRPLWTGSGASPSPPRRQTANVGPPKCDRLCETTRRLVIRALKSETAVGETLTLVFFCGHYRCVSVCEKFKNNLLFSMKNVQKSGP